MNHWAGLTFIADFLEAPYKVASSFLIESLRNDDDGGIENGKKAIGLDWQNNNFARASRFFVHFSAFVARLQRETT